MPIYSKDCLNVQCLNIWWSFHIHNHLKNMLFEKISNWGYNFRYSLCIFISESAGLRETVSHKNRPKKYMEKVIAFKSQCKILYTFFFFFLYFVFLYIEFTHFCMLKILWNVQHIHTDSIRCKHVFKNTTSKPKH